MKDTNNDASISEIFGVSEERKEEFRKVTKECLRGGNLPTKAAEEFCNKLKPIEPNEFKMLVAWYLNSQQLNLMLAAKVLHD